MHYTLKAGFALLLGASALAGTAVAQDIGNHADDGVTVFRMDRFDSSSERAKYEELRLIASDPAQVEAAQAEVRANPQLESVLVSQNVQLNNVIAIETAANGGKIIYLR